MKYPSMFFAKKIRSTSLLFLLLFFVSNSYSQLTITTDVPNAQYEAGETADFIVTSTSTGTATWTLTYDPFAPVIASGTLNLVADQPMTVSHSEATPGVVILNVTQTSTSFSNSAAALFSTYDIAPFETIPADLETFWNDQKALLAAVPMNPVVELYSDDWYSETYRITLDNIHERKVYGYLSVPKSTGPYPAVITLPAYGDIPDITAPDTSLAVKAGVLSFSVGIHNVPPDQMDPNAYEPDYYALPDSNYYRYALLGAVRAIDYLFTRSDFDGQNVGATGVSQGAGLSLCLAGIDDRVNLLMYSVPVLCQNSGLAHDKAGGFPNYINNSRTTVMTQAHEDSTISATRYYDAGFLVQSCDFPVMGAVSYRDPLTPAATGLTAFNQLPNTAPRLLIHSIDLAHDNPPEFNDEGRYDFIHRHFPGSVATTLWPYNNFSGYLIDAGQDTILHIDSTLTLNGIFDVEAIAPPSPFFEVKWSMVQGPGIATFANDATDTTTVTFDTEGDYILQYMVSDTSKMTSDSRFFTLFDYIAITVEDCAAYTLHYPDTDGDGYGDGNGTPLSVCEGTTPQSGYANNDSDCDDTDPNDVHLVINDNSIPEGVQQANSTINSAGTTDNNTGLITFLAGDEIVLNIDFVAAEGTNFIAKIDSCNAPPASLVQAIEENELEILNEKIEPENTLLENIELEKQELHIYPNPTTSSLFVKRNIETTASFSILNMVGKRVLMGKLDASLNEIKIGDLKNGMYIFLVNGTVKKFVKIEGQ